ncbi:MAG: insulinase family protein [Oscillospiraceae bacterium]|nr:insulinase family protein [Oscillospiraceae bacterium]
MYTPEPPEIITLPNKLRLVFEESPTARSAAINIYIGSGSRYETPETAGASHFLEHMLFKGTMGRTALQIAQQMDEIGGQINAYTAKEYTCMYGQALTEHTQRAFGIMLDMLLCSRLDSSELETEKGVILEEIGMVNDTPEELCADKLYETVWPDSMLGGNILGTVKTVKSITPAVLRRHMEAYYTPKHTVISVCGRFDRVALLEMAEKAFEGSQEGDSLPPDDFAAFKYDKSLVKKRTEQTNLILAVEGFPINDDRRFSLAVISTALGGGSSSRLNQRIREELGLAYSVYTFNASHMGAGVFGVSAGVAHHNRQRAMDEILAIVTDTRKGLHQSEFLRAKAQIKSGLVMSYEQSASRAAFSGRGLLLENKITSEDELLERLDRLTLEQVNETANRLLNFEKYALSVVGKV